jgi:AcrR family transcriptional regulator
MPTVPPAPPSPQPPALRVRYACSEQRGTPAKSTVNAIWRITAACASVTPLISRRPYKKVAREQSEQRTRDALLDAADEEFDEGRWRRSSLDAVAAKAGVTKQTLLRHFGSKDGLLLQALARGAVQVLDQRPGRRRRGRRREPARPLRSLRQARAADRHLAGRARRARQARAGRSPGSLRLGRPRVRALAAAARGGCSRPSSRGADRALRRARLVAAVPRSGARAVGRPSDADRHDRASSRRE